MRDNNERLGLNKMQSNDEVLVSTNPPLTSLDFAVPTEFVELPSKGKYYPEGHPVKGKEHLEIKFMTSKEEDILTSRSLLKKGVAIERMLSSLLIDKTIDIDSLLICDKNALIVAARISGYGQMYSTKVVCPVCEETIENEFDLNELKLFYGNNDILSDDGVIKIQLPKTKALVCCKLMNGHDERYLTQMIENKKKLKLQDSFLTDQMKMFVISINGNIEKHALNHFIDNMPSLDARHLRKVYQESIPNVDMMQKLTCSQCETESEVMMPLGTTFFWPK